MFKNALPLDSYDMVNDVVEKVINNKLFIWGDKMNIFEVIAEQKIQEALKNGAFDNLPGKGKPLIIEDLSGSSPEDFMAYKILKNAGLLPPEMELRKAMSELEKKINDTNCEDEKYNLKAKLNKMMTVYNVMMERMKRK